MSDEHPLMKVITLSRGDRFVTACLMMLQLVYRTSGFRVLQSQLDGLWRLEWGYCSFFSHASSSGHLTSCILYVGVQSRKERRFLPQQAPGPHLVRILLLSVALQVFRALLVFLMRVRPNEFCSGYDLPWPRLVSRAPFFTTFVGKTIGLIHLPQLNSRSSNFTLM